MTRYLTPVQFVAFAVAVSGCAVGPIIRPTGDSAFGTNGPLAQRPIVFATDDYYIRPTTTAAIEGRLRVPERHASPGGRTVELHFVRFSSTAATPADPIVYLAGGPGGSGTLSAAGDRFPAFNALRAAADVIALDQRGTPLASPHPVCPGEWNYPLDRPFDGATLAATMQPYLTRCAAAAHDSVDLDAYTTPESVEDLEDLRRALHAERLNLWAISYGTHLALAYLRRYPNRVAHAVLAGIEGPDDTYKEPRNVERVLRSVDSAVAADDGMRDRIPGFIAELRRTLGALERHPTVTTHEPRTKQDVTVTIGPGDLQRAVFFALGERQSIARLTARLIPIFAGDYSALGLFAYRTRTQNRESIMALSMDCASGVSSQRAARIEAQIPASVLGDASVVDARSTCPAWPVHDLGDAYRTPIVSSVPVLAISGTLDARTPPEVATTVLAGFTDRRDLILEGGSHDDDLILSSPRIVEAMRAFFRGDVVRTERVRLAPIRFKRP